LWLSENVFDSFEVSGAALFVEGKQEVYFFDEASRSQFSIDQLNAISDRGEPVLERERESATCL
jgi:hypothetical protein